MNWKVVLSLFGLFALISCGPPPPQAMPIVGELDLAHALQTLALDLSRQLGPTAATRTLVIDPLLDGRTGQQTRGTQRVEQEFAQNLVAAITNLSIFPFNDGGATQSRYVITGTLSAQPEADRFRLSVALSDRSSGLVVAQSAVPFREPGIDPTPSRFYGDSPSLVRDRSIDGYIKTAETPRGQAADALYIEQVPTAALLAAALTAYNAEHWEEALSGYNAALARADGQQLRTFNGIYLCNMQLGREAEAEAAFAKIAALGLATNNLAVKLLFRPGTTDFWPDPKINGPYPMWLRQIAEAASASGSCLNVVGHTSRSGTEAINDRLSLSRASTIQQRLEHEKPGLTRKMRVSGVGSRENLVGTGTDDASDALDRRVEFRVVACEG
jgi:outer membrane protein OmpA-like peptidoglycan-associated protein